MRQQSIAAVPYLISHKEMVEEQLKECVYVCIGIIRRAIGKFP